MGDRLPDPVLLVAFEATAPLPDCLRAALNTARRLHLGIAFEWGPDDAVQQYIVQQWQTTEDVLAMWNPEYAVSVAEHEGTFHG